LTIEKYNPDQSVVKRIYLDPKLDKLPEYYDRDIIKVFIKNPKEAYILWGISLTTVNRILKFFHCSKEQISFKLKVIYYDNQKIFHEQEIQLKPFTTSYLLKLDIPVKNLKAEIIAFYEDKNLSTLHSASINLPSSNPSKLLDKNWVKKEWVLEEGVQFIFGTPGKNSSFNQEILVLSNAPNEESNDALEVSNSLNYSFLGSSEQNNESK
jgi:hypothetical protein